MLSSHRLNRHFLTNMKVHNTMQIKLCIDCTHYRLDSFGKARHGRCARDDHPSPVDGSHVRFDDLPYCATERKEYTSIDTCRIDAKYFVAKEVTDV